MLQDEGEQSYYRNSSQGYINQEGYNESLNDNMA